VAEFKVLVCDDDLDQAKGWASDLVASARGSATLLVESVPRRELAQDLTRLRARQKQARRRQVGSPADPDDTSFDGRDLVIVDFDLLNLEGPTDSGESVAYMARCYTTCGIIVDLNQFGTNPFDATFKGHPASFADLNVGSEQLTNPGLWKTPFSGFRPWSWPLLGKQIQQRRKQIELVERSLELPVLEALGFPDSVVEVLSLRALGLIGSPQLGRTVKLRQVVRSPMGLRNKDRPMSEASEVRISAARICKWLEDVVIPGEDILVDAPHLVSRFPSLLDKGARQNLNSLPDLERASRALPINHRVLKGTTIPEPVWISRPVWFWPLIQGNREIEEIVDPWRVRESAFGFAEDASRFLPKSELTEFSASDLASVFVRRLVVSRRSEYATRFHGRRARDFHRVQYLPAHPQLY
jgi:hypothetical protein